MLRHHPTTVVGGAQVQCMLMGRELTERGYEVHYVFESPVWKKGPVLGSDGVWLHGIRRLRGHSLGVANWRALAKTMRRIGADVYYQRIAGPYPRAS